MLNKVRIWLCITGMASLVLISNALAVVSTMSITATSFIDPFTIAESTPLSFGNVISNTASTYTLDTSDNVTGTGAGTKVSGTSRSGDYLISDSGGSGTIDIAVGNFAANNGVTLQNAVCSYDGGGDISGCNYSGAAAPGVGKTLTIGIQAVVDGTQGNGTSASPTFQISVTYN